MLAGLFRRCRVGLVTPLRDGMNLVAKEYVAAQDPEDPGVLVLSQFAGAAEQLEEALIVNPHDPANLATAMRRALEMPLGERRRATGRFGAASPTRTSAGGASASSPRSPRRRRTRRGPSQRRRSLRPPRAR